MAPRLLRGRSCEHHAASRQLSMSSIDVVRGERHVRKSADTIFVAGRCEQNHLGLAARNSQFYPALFCVKRLIRQDLESELLGVEDKSLFLISNRNAHEL